jgi:phenylalanyl-tRNA synthetase beta subunit
LRTNLSDGLKESIKLNTLNAPLLGIKDVKVFEIGKVFFKDGEEWRVAYGDKKEIKEVTLDDFIKASPDASALSIGSPRDYAWPDHSQKHTGSADVQKFQMWSLYPFIVRDIALWVPEGVSSDEVASVISANVNELVVKGPELFDTFTKEGRTSYAFRLVFQSFNRTLTDEEVGSVMDKINSALQANSNWELR